MYYLFMFVACLYVVIALLIVFCDSIMKEECRFYDENASCKYF